MEELSPYQVVCLKSAELAVHVALMGSISASWPLLVQANWEQRVGRIIDNLEKEISEIQEFGEAFDEQ